MDREESGGIGGCGCRMASARAKAEQALQAAVKAQSDADKGRQKAYSYDPNFVQPGAPDLPAADTTAIARHI